MKVLISGYYGSGNVGDEAVLVAIIQGLKGRDPEIEITVLSASPGLTAELNGVRAIHRTAWHRIWREMRRAEIFISGGGTLFQDVTSSRSFWYYLGLIIMAKIFRKKVMVFAQGFGPLRKKHNRKVARAVLNRVDLITVRDEDSLRALERLKVRKPEKVLTADPTALLEVPAPSEGRKIFSLEAVPLDKPLLGISVRSSSARRKVEEETLRTMAVVIDKLVQRYDVRPVFLLFQCPDDMKEAKKVIRHMHEEPGVIFRICRPDEMLAVFSQLDFVIGMRLHSLIFAAINSVPAFGVSYDPKVASFAGSLQLPFIHFDQRPGVQAMMEAVEAAFLEKQQIRSGLEAKKQEFRDQAALNFDLFFRHFGKEKVK